MRDILDKLDQLNELAPPSPPPGRGDGGDGRSNHPWIFFNMWILSLRLAVQSGAYGLPPLPDVEFGMTAEELRNMLNVRQTRNRNSLNFEMYYSNKKTQRAIQAQQKWASMNKDSNWNPYPYFNVELTGSNFGYVNDHRVFSLRASIACSPLKRIEVENGEVVDNSFFDKSFETQVIEGEVSQGGNEYQILRKIIEYIHQCYEYCL